MAERSRLICNLLTCLLVWVHSVPVYCSLEQWEIYKLDPAYDCYVHAAPKFTTISRADSYATATAQENAFPEGLRASTPLPGKKRQAPSPTSPTSNENSPQGSRKKYRTTIEILSESEDGRDAEHPINVADSDLEEDEVEEIVVGFIPPRRPAGARAYGFGTSFVHESLLSEREQERRTRAREEQRRQRREHVASRAQQSFKTEPAVDPGKMFDGYAAPESGPTDGAKKRKGL